MNVECFYLEEKNETFFGGFKEGFVFQTFFCINGKHLEAYFLRPAVHSSSDDPGLFENYIFQIA